MVLTVIDAKLTLTDVLPPTFMLLVSTLPPTFVVTLVDADELEVPNKVDYESGPNWGTIK